MVPQGGGSGAARSVGRAGVHGRARAHRGRVAGIFPEGTRSPDGRLYKGKTGVARLALATGAPVVPVGVVDTKVTGKKLGFIPWADHPVIRFGTPLDFSAYAGREEDRKLVRWVTDEIMAAIHALSGQELAGAYNEVPAQNPIERIKQVLPHERL